MSSLGRRLLTAAILIPLVVLAVLGLPTRYIAAVFALIVLGGAWEWAGLVGWRSLGERALYTVALAPMLFLAYRVGAAPPGQLAVLGAGIAWWLLAFWWVQCFQRNIALSGIDTAAVRFFSGWLVLAPCWLALIALHGRGDGGPHLVMFLLLLMWTADSGAYFVGRRFGRHRLAGRVSPGKTWEGVLGGMFAAALLAAIGAVFLDSPIGNRVLFVLLCLLVVPVSILGDLFESLFKRRAGVKDSSALLPGHGGVLDRIDSLTAAAPFFALGLYWLDSFK